MSTERRQLNHVRNAMVSRCEKPTDKAYANYGGRGITVCEQWRRSLQDFIDDMGSRPPSGMLDRIDNDGPYCPANCKWSTRKEQNSNRRNCIYVLDGDEKITLREICRRRNVKYRPTVKRIRRGWPLDRALTEPLHPPTGIAAKTKSNYKTRKAA